MKKQSFASVPSQVNFIEMEHETLRRWRDLDIENKYLHKNDQSKKNFRFLDGPITANNPMGVQHGQGRALKDLFQRYKNAHGYKQRFQNGFDCQGLWLEVQEEKDLGLNSKRDIETYGIEKFCIRCRDRVNKYSAIQTEQSKRLGMFMDWENSYYTMSETNNVYIWYFLKKCHEKGWLYKGIDSMPWCPRCGTAISKHELSDDGYQTVKHTSVYAKFALKSDPHTFFLIWTTTPWTLAVNVAVAANPVKDYVKVKLTTGESLILAKNRLTSLTDEYEIVKSIKGKELVGETYSGPFDELPAQKDIIHQVIPWDEVSDEDGSGLVHIAPGAGEEDFLLGKIHKLPVLAPLDDFGIYLPGYGQFTGKFALDVKGEVFTSLKEKGLFYKTETVTHSYPHCWRCKQELVFRTTDEWFISADEVRPLMKKASKKVNWLPESSGKRMQDWLNNMGDWPISRRRYWGLALPFYECASGGCDELTVIGSKEELRSLALNPEKVDTLPELHRPWIDEIKIKCPKCGGTASRVTEVGDCWLDAGIVPFSTVKYLEDKEYWKDWFRFDFITEYLGQVKLWFYSTLFMSVTLENTFPWKNVLATGYIVDEKGEPMHKTKGNYVPFDEAAEKMGVDIMRWVYFSSNPYENIKFGYGMGDVVRRQFMLTLWNVYSFFITYANLEKWTPSTKKLSSSQDVLDVWIKSRLTETVEIVDSSMDKYDPFTPTQALQSFVNDLSTWYIRRSRDRMNPDFFSTSYDVLTTLVKTLSPFMPFVTDEIFRNLTKKESVHLEVWQKITPLSESQKDLLQKMVIVRKICEHGNAQRKIHNLPVRQPLAKITIKGPNNISLLSSELLQLIKDELNVEDVSFSVEENLSCELDTRLTPALLAKGQARLIIRSLQQARKDALCRLDETVDATLPDWPAEHEAEIKQKTLVERLTKGDTLTIIRKNK